MGTRKDAVLSMILSDLHTLYHPPTTQAPLQADKEKAGKSSDHDIIIFAPKTNNNFKVVRKKKIIKTRPMPDSVIPDFGRDFQNQTRDDVLKEDNVDTKAFNFHRTLIPSCNKHFPEKSLKISTFDKKWITPFLKILSRKVKAEFHRNRKSAKWRALKKEWKVKKKEAVCLLHQKFVTDLKSTNPSKFYQICKKIGTGDQMNGKELDIKCLSGLSDQECAEAVGQGFASVSSHFEPLDRTKLPARLPATLSPVESFIESEVPHLRLFLVKSMMPLKRWVATEKLLTALLGNEV